MNGNYAVIEYLVSIAIVVWAFVNFTILSAFVAGVVIIGLEILGVYMIPLDYKKDEN